MGRHTYFAIFKQTTEQQTPTQCNKTIFHAISFFLLGVSFRFIFGQQFTLAALVSFRFVHLVNQFRFETNGTVATRCDTANKKRRTENERKGKLAREIKV